MRVFAVSDLHVDYECNAKWFSDISLYDFTEDVIIIAGDISDSLILLDRTLRAAVRRFKTVLFTPGNHDLWHFRDKNIRTVFDKYAHVCSVVDASGAWRNTFRTGRLCIQPLLSWYDYSFGQPTDELLSSWMDYRACRWPINHSMSDVADRFESMNQIQFENKDDIVITFSHFLPRKDLLPKMASRFMEMLHPVLGASRIDAQIRGVNSKIHVYGHSHIHQYVCIHGITYINNALGYPHEIWASSKRLLCVLTL
jgi:predicted phosphodiesterase